MADYRGPDHGTLDGFSFSANAVWDGSQMLVCCDPDLHSSNDILYMFSYTPGATSWIKVQHIPPTFAGLINATAVWTGSQMLVWGGGYDYTFSLGGIVYDPLTTHWKPMSRSPCTVSYNRTAFCPRALATAVWTGTQMLIWGGSGPGVAEDAQGAAYVPATDSWQLLPEASFLGDRVEHTAIWTGKEMIVWGGLDTTSARLGVPVGTGAYNPTTRTWRALSTVGAPSPRYGQSAVWTGSEMLVWGGRAEHAVFGDGAAYDPGTDTWAPISSVGAPSPRAFHTATWVGARMLVWGGETDPRDSPVVPPTRSTLNDGAAYDPVANTWTRLPDIGAPTARARHTAIWTGSQLLIFAGCSLCRRDPIYPYTPASGGAIYTPPQSFVTPPLKQPTGMPAGGGGGMAGCTPP